MSDTILLIWFFVDVVWSAAIFGGCAYVVFWKGHSGLWFILASILACSLGGTQLYKRLSERVALKPSPDPGETAAKEKHDV